MDNIHLNLINAIVSTLVELTSHHFYCEAYNILYSLHEKDLVIWAKTKDMLLNSSDNTKLLSLYATLLRASVFPSPQQAYHLIPGLSVYQIKDFSVPSGSLTRI